jgi:hypothetical protein
MQIKVDYHFHPNFPLFIPFFGEYLANKKAKAIWKAFTEKSLDAVLITEHAYKNPKTSFEILEKNKPKNAKTLIIPGVEALTKEGTDIIVFAKNKKEIYCHKSLMTPWKLKTLELVKLVKKHPSLYGIVVHPYTPGTTGIVHNNGIEVTRKAIKELGFVELYNCSFTALIRLFNILGLNKILKKKHSQMINTANAPEALRNKNTIITGGSDAHHVKEIGDYIGIDANNKKNIFDIITERSGKITRMEKSISALISNAFTVSREWLMKNLHLYTIDKPI